MGLGVFTIVFAASGYSTNQIDELAVFCGWMLYVLFGLDLKDRSRALSIGLGLILLTVPTTSIIGNNSLNQIRDGLVGATRIFSAANDSVILTFSVRVSSFLNLLPITMPNAIVKLGDTNQTRDYLTYSINIADNYYSTSGGIMYPLGDFTYDMTFKVSEPYVDDFRGNVTEILISCEQGGTAFSGLNQASFCPDAFSQWDWITSSSVPW